MDQNIIDEKIVAKKVFELRSMIYGFLSRAYLKEIGEDFFNNLEIIVPIFKKIAHVTGSENIRRSAVKLNEYRSSLNLEKSTAIENLEREYATLFLGVGIGYLEHYVSPYESVYLSPDGQIMGEPYDAVMETYFKYDVEISASFKEPGDHISVELEFMRILCEKAAENLEKEEMGRVVEILGAQRDFIDEHLIRWAHKFCGDLRNASENIIYIALSDLTSEYIKFDTNLIRILADVYAEF